MGNANLEIGNGLNLIKGSLTDLDANTYCANAGIGASTQTPTAYDQAATFNGGNQYLIIPSNSSLQIGGKSFSISGWINPSVLSNTIVSKVSYGILEWEIEFIDGVLIVLLGNGGSSWTTSFNSSVRLSANQWTFFCVTFNGSTANIYINGSTSSGSTNASITTSGSGTFQIASNPYGGWYTGSVSGVGFWNTALSTGQITALYNAGNGLTYSGIQQAGLSSNLVSYWELNENSGASLYYDSVTSTGNNLTPYNTPTNSVGPIATATASSQSLINNFVKGIKGLGLWNNFVCWPLRSSQNASATQTAYSLGGLGSYNGSLVNNPFWTSTGIQKTTDSYQYISLPNFDIASAGQFSATSVFNLSSYSNSNQIIPIGINCNGSNVVAGTGLFVYVDSGSLNVRVASQNMSGGNGERYIDQSPSRSSFLGNNFNWQSGAIGSSPSFNGSSDVNGTYNSNVQGTGTAFTNGSSPSSGIGLTQNGSGWSSNISFSSFLTTAISQTQQSQLYSLYKSTLGVGLNLQP
jgi:hypothetical protein